MEERIDPETLAALLGLLTHDLRNSLAGVHDNAGYVRDELDGPDPDVDDALRDCLSSCLTMLDIVDNMDVLALALRGGPALELEPIAIATVVRDVVQRLEPIARGRATEVTVSLPDAADAISVLSQRRILTNCICNLVRNAIQHSDRTPVEVAVVCGDGHCTLRVEDGGTPVAPHLTDGVFTALGQLASKGTKGGRYGRGLGLYAARVAAEAAAAPSAR